MIVFSSPPEVVYCGGDLRTVAQELEYLDTKNYGIPKLVISKNVVDEFHKNVNRLIGSSSETVESHGGVSEFIGHKVIYREHAFTKDKDRGEKQNDGDLSL